MFKQFLFNCICFTDKMRVNRNSAIETVGKKYNFAMSVISGSVAENKDLNSLKNLSMSEILKLAEDRAKLNGINRRATDNPWHKRMAVSDNIRRHQTRPNSLAIREQIGSTTAAEDPLDNNEEFFENLMKKMTEEKFMPCSTANRKRTCLWNKENSSDRMKRQRENKMKSKLIPPRMEMFGKRLLPRQGNNLPATTGAEIQSQCVAVETRHQDRDVPRYKSTLDVIHEDINMREGNSRFEHSNSSTATTITASNGSFCWDQTADNGIAYCSQETLKLDHNRPVRKIDLDSVHETSPFRYNVEIYPRNIWDSLRLSGNEKDRQLSMVVESPVLHAIETGSDISIQLTPPVDCKACNTDEEEYDDNVNNNSGRLLSPMISRPSDFDMMGIADESLFT